MGTYEPLLHFLTKTIYEEVPQEVVHLAKRAMIDTTGVIVLGMDTPPLPQALQIPQPCGGQGTILSVGTGYSAKDAALYNGMASHVLDMDDISFASKGHPSVTVLPAVYAVGEEINASGAEVLRAYLAGLEIICQMGKVFGEPVHAAGWHATSVFGPIGAAVGCGVLFHFTEEQFRSAIGAAASLGFGLRANFGTSTKPFHVGVSCQNGVLVAQMVRKGLTASHAALDGAEGFLQLFAHLPYQEIHTEALQALLGNPYSIAGDGFPQKVYPSCSSNHPSVGAMEVILQKQNINPQNIAKIEAFMGIGPYRELVTPKAKNWTEARFSPGFHFALQLYQIPIVPDSFCDTIVQKEEIQHIIDVTEIYNDPYYDAYPEGTMGGARVQITLKDGTVYEGECLYPLGYKENPLSEAQLRQKFDTCCLTRLGAEKTEQLYTSLQEIEKMPAIREVLRSTL